MSDRYNGFVVVLEESIKDEDAQDIIKAIMMIKGVIKVTPLVEDFQSLTAQIKYAHSLKQKIYKLFDPEMFK